MHVPELIGIAIDICARTKVCSRGTCIICTPYTYGSVEAAHTYGRTSQKTEYVHVPPTLNQRPQKMHVNLRMDVCMKQSVKIGCVGESGRVCFVYFDQQMGAAHPI